MVAIGYPQLKGPENNPDIKVHGANMGPNWILSAPDGPHVGPINLVIGEPEWTLKPYKQYSDRLPCIDTLMLSK